MNGIQIIRSVKTASYSCSPDARQTRRPRFCRASDAPPSPTRPPPTPEPLIPDVQTKQRRKPGVNNGTRRCEEVQLRSLFASPNLWIWIKWREGADAGVLVLTQMRQRPSGLLRSSLSKRNLDSRGGSASPAKLGWSHGGDPPLPPPPH